MIITMIIGEDKETFAARRTATVVRALELARECTRGPAADGLPGGAAGTLSSELAHRLLPHLESDARLASAVPGAQGTSLRTELSDQRRELGQLVEELDRVLVDALRTPNRRAGRAVEAVIRLLDRHLVTERELWTALTDAGVGEEALSTLAHDAEATERLGERSLRFVWHPPVAPTAARALWWTSPGTRRVLVLDAADASGVREQPADAGKEEA